MKYLSMFALVGVIWWSWSFATTPQAISTSSHLSVQTALTEFIRNYIKEQVPNVQNIEFHKVWTEPFVNKTIKATFEYSFQTPSEDQKLTTSRIQGQAVLSSKETPDDWSLDQVTINDEALEFPEGAVITPETKK
jgi:hypothetical protein